MVLLSILGHGDESACREPCHTDEEGYGQPALSLQPSNETFLSPHGIVLRSRNLGVCVHLCFENQWRAVNVDKAQPQQRTAETLRNAPCNTKVLRTYHLGNTEQLLLALRMVGYIRHINCLGFFHLFGML